MSKIHGIDISHWTGKVDFTKLVVNGIQFAIFKAGEVPTRSKKEFLDDKYERNIREAKAHGIISGAYYYFHPSIGASRQARHFDKIMQVYGMPDLPPVIDVEDTDKMEPQDIAKVLRSMVMSLSEKGYKDIIVYSRWGFLVNQMGEPDWLQNGFEYLDQEEDSGKVIEKHVNIYLWLAQYNTKLTKKPADMSNVIMWQYTDRLALPGCPPLDGNYWLKSEKELNELAEIDGGAEEEPEYPFLTDTFKKRFILRKRKEEERRSLFLKSWERYISWK